MSPRIVMNRHVRGHPEIHAAGRHLLVPIRRCDGNLVNGLRKGPTFGGCPSKWTDSDRDSDRGAMMMALELSRAQIARRRVQSAGVAGVDEPREVIADVLERLASHQMDRFDLERLDEVFGGSVRSRPVGPAGPCLEPGGRPGRSALDRGRGACLEAVERGRELYDRAGTAVDDSLADVVRGVRDTTAAARRAAAARPRTSEPCGSVSSSRPRRTRPCGGGSSGSTGK